MSDECGMRVEYDVEEVIDDGRCDFAYRIERRWILWDECGDSTHATQTINVIDTTPPLAIGLPGDTLIASCAGLPPIPTVTWQENCDQTFGYSFSQTTIDSTCSFNYTVVRTWEAWDQCGNRSTGVQRIELRDTAAPVISGIPADLRIPCGDTYNLPLVTSTDDCDTNPQLTHAVRSLPPNCDTLLHDIHTWTATDRCGETTTAEWRVYSLNSTGPVVVSAPGDTAIRCDQPLPAQVPVFADDCTANVPVAYTDSVVAGPCPAYQTVYRTWTALDACGRTASARQIVTLIDSVGPKFTPLADTIFMSCSDSTLFQEPTLVPNCGAVVDLPRQYGLGAGV